MEAPNSVRHRSRRFCFALAVAVAALSTLGRSSAEATVLYDPNLGNSPIDQGWSFAQFPGGATGQVAAGTFSFDSGPVDGNRAGFFNLDQVLDSTLGYRLSFELSVTSESHASVDRAGFSIIAVSSDVTKAIELGFWDDEVWAQDDSLLFTHAEGTTNFVTTGNDLIRYDLFVSGMQYQLFAEGGLILSGAMRDYTEFTAPNLPLPPELLDPYEVPNLLFLGDDTFSARAGVRLGRVELNALQAVPEPTSLALFGFGVLSLGLGLRFRRR